MLRSTLRGDHRCVFFLGAVMLLTLFSLSIVSAGYVQRVYGTCYSNELNGGEWRNINFDYARNPQLDTGFYYNTANLQGYDLSIWNGNIPQGGEITWHDINDGGIQKNCFLPQGCEKSSYLYDLSLTSGIYDGYWGFQHFGCLNRGCNSQNSLFMNTMKNQASVECVGNKAVFTYSGQFYSGPYYYPGDNEIDCNVEMQYTEIWNGTAPAEYNCIFPQVEKIEILPEYWRFETDNLITSSGKLYYEDVFRRVDDGMRYLEPFATLKIYDKINRKQFYVNWTMKINNSKNETVYFKNNAEITGKDFTVYFPYKNVTQDSLLIFQVQVCDLDKNCDETSGKRTAYLYTPKFDVIAQNIDAGNVLFGQNELVENKPIATRAYISINSSVKKIEDSGEITVINNYIDAIKNVSVDFIVDGKKEMSSTGEVVNYEDMEVLKQKVTNVILNIDERIKALNTLDTSYKIANNTRNFIGYIPNGKSGEITLQVTFDGNKINEFNSTNNNFSKTYDLRQQKDPDFKFRFAGINIKFKEAGLNFTIENYNNQKLRMNEAYFYMNSAFPFDPTKTSYKISPTTSNYIISTGRSPKNVNLPHYLLGDMQKQADANGWDMLFGIIPSKAADLSKKQWDGITEEGYSKVALIREDKYYSTYAHEAGHLLGLYLDEEQKSGPPCPPENYGEYDTGLLASDGWCMNQTSGKSCKTITPSDPMGKNGEIISIWKIPNENGCHTSITDGPLNFNLLPFDPNSMSYAKKFDVMSLSHVAWPRTDPTYKKLKEEILV